MSGPTRAVTNGSAPSGKDSGPRQDEVRPPARFEGVMAALAFVSLGSSLLARVLLRGGNYAG